MKISKLHCYIKKNCSNLYAEKEVNMYSEGKKMHLIEEVIKVKNEAVLKLSWKA